MIYKLIISLFISLYPKNCFHLVIDDTYLFHSKKSYNKIKIKMLVISLDNITKANKSVKKFGDFIMVEFCFSELKTECSLRFWCFDFFLLKEIRILEGYMMTLFWSAILRFYCVDAPSFLFIEILLLRKALLWFYKNIWHKVKAADWYEEFLHSD